LDGQAAGVIDGAAIAVHGGAARHGNPVEEEFTAGIDLKDVGAVTVERDLGVAPNAYRGFTRHLQMPQLQEDVGTVQAGSEGNGVGGAGDTILVGLVDGIAESDSARRVNIRRTGNHEVICSGKGETVLEQLQAEPEAALALGLRPGI
jgi:hypothetical protein